MLTAIYIKGFKTFARPVRMPLEGGVTAIVGPNGSGKSNITDAVLFALGEQSPGVLRAGAMSELIFAGSETLPASNIAEVTLVLDNSSGEISLPYREVALTRRITRGGETEYRINGSRVRLADVRSVAGEAGLGRHSILRQGAVDAIVAGGAAACRQALEEAAGLGVYRRRRVSASRRLEKADEQLERSRQLEVEISAQLRRIEREAAAAREYRELESRYRELSLAHLYRIATRGLEGHRKRLAQAEARTAGTEQERSRLRKDEERLSSRLRELDESLRALERRQERLDDALEGLRSRSGRAEHNVYRAETADGRAGGDLVPRMEAELARVVEGLKRLHARLDRLEREHAEREAERARSREQVSAARERNAAAERERSRLAAGLEEMRARMDRLEAGGGRRVLAERVLERLDEVGGALRGAAADLRPELSELRDGLRRCRARSERLETEASRRSGALSAALGRAESRVRALTEPSPVRSGRRLGDILRPLPGFEAAVEAALGEQGGGVLARDLDEGIRLLSGSERVAVRLDARRAASDGEPPGRPLVECVEVLDDRYAEAVERLLDGIFVVERPDESPHLNGYVAVTRDGLRLTRTSVSLRTGGRFVRRARLEAAVRHLEALKNGPGGMLYELRERQAESASRLEHLSRLLRELASLHDRTERSRRVLLSETERRIRRAEQARREHHERERRLGKLREELSAAQRTLAEAEEAVREAGEAYEAAALVADSSRAAAEDSARRLRRLKRAVEEGEERRRRISARLEALRSSGAGWADSLPGIAARAARHAERVEDTARGRRDRLRRERTEMVEAHRRLTEERNALARRDAELAGRLGSSRAEVERLKSELARSEAAAAEAERELREEWAADLETARGYAGRHSPETEEERQRLARRLKRFGDVNLLALAQQEELRERHAFVSAQRADAEEAAGELRRIIARIDREIERRFTETFRRVREAFGEMMPRMMEGAAGSLELSEEGVEIGIRLGRKGRRPLRVLSGGERALLALAFLFAIFLSRPGRESGAFCILDEAEAALDDVNLARFLSVVDSHRANGQFLLVTHQKRTMAAADVLYGVVQDASGATAVVSKRMQGD